MPATSPPNRNTDLLTESNKVNTVTFQAIRGVFGDATVGELRIARFLREPEAIRYFNAGAPIIDKVRWFAENPEWSSLPEPRFLPFDGEDNI